MNWARAERTAPLNGIVAVVLWVIGIWLVAGPGHLPDTGSTPEKILRVYHDHGTAIQVGAWLVMLGVVFFLYFVGSLRGALYGAEGAPGRLASIASFGGVATGICVLLIHTPSFAAAQTTKHLSPDAAQALILVDDTFFYAAEFTIAVLFLATAVSIFRFGALPPWLGWVSLVFGIAALIPFVGWAVLAVGLPLWTLATAWLLYARAGAAPAIS